MCVESAPDGSQLVSGGGLGEQTLLSDVAPINITVNAAIAEATIADKIVDALTEYNRRSGPLQLQIA